MSESLAVYHGHFGRVCLYSMDRKMVPHGHREGHLIFHLQGPPGEVVVNDTAYPLSAGQAVAVSPWQGHYYKPLHAYEPTLAVVLYIRPAWFLEAARRASASLCFGRNGVEMTEHLSRLVFGTAQAMLDGDREDLLIEDRLCDLTQSAFDQSWQWTPRGAQFTGPILPRRDFRIRKALKYLQDNVGAPLKLNNVAREVGLSRPHFFKLFRAQVGLTPNLFCNALRMERAIEQLANSENAVADIGFDLGFSSQASFSRFFISNGVVPPSAYRRSVHVT
ncbi:AraC family transcriptional regulator [uncultured Tateyamaria sp.]|uniref:AraC family transcriptional regulator n=1 Tax=uncultured Tateyamaria sp. TaxID=455651 RepID=UPI0026017422|nr:AraC family transcriptional regulator [uncultured Tateyamaria sp.]